MNTNRYLRSIVLCTTLSVAAYNITAQTQSIPEFYKIMVYAVENVDIRDREGSVLRPIGPIGGMILRGEVEYSPGDFVKDLEEERRQHPDRVPFISPHDISFLATNAKHEIRFRTTGSELMGIEIRKGSGFNREDANLLIIYGSAVEHGIRPGVDARINFTPTSVGDLQIDNDGNGSYETTIRPRLRAVGQMIKDAAAPRLRMTASISGAIATVTVSATDDGVGLHDIRYFIGERSPHTVRYTGPFAVDISKGEVPVFVTARDRANNESLEFKYFEAGREKVGYDPYNMRGNPPGIRKTVPNNSPGSETDPFQLKSKPE